jgi:pyridoxal phosphate enzyme (YggS family)
MTDIQHNWEKVQERAVRAAQRSSRNPDEINIVAVSKTFPGECIRSAVEAGVTTIGENRVQEAWQKYQKLGKIASWHLVGHLQTNKVKRALQIFDVIQSVDSLHLAEEISRRCEQMGRDVEILLEVKTSDEPTKFGIAQDEAVEVAGRIAKLPHLKISGLMTMGKWTSNEREVRNCFQTLARLRDQINASGSLAVSLPHLSMGMSGDFEWAIEEGATIVRIGTAIFGPRST